MSPALLVGSDAMLSTLRRELRRISGMLIDTEEMVRVLREQVIKRDVLEGEPSTDAARLVSRASDRGSRTGNACDSASNAVDAVAGAVD